MNILYFLVAFIVLIVLADRLMPMVMVRFSVALTRRLAGLRLQTATVAGHAAPYLEGGQGEPLVLIHGFGADKDNFTLISYFLTRRYRVISPDLPGFGDGMRDLDGKYGIDDQVAWLHALLDQLGLGKVHLGGSSMGGFIAAQFAATYPERVASVWLLGSAGTNAAHSTGLMTHYLATGEAPLLARNEQEFANLLALSTSKSLFLPYSMRHVLAKRAIADYALHKRILETFVNTPYLEEKYSKLETPALIVWGDQDRILNPDGAPVLAALFSHSQVKMMPGIGHLPMLESPRATACDYLAFRDRIDHGSMP